MLAPIYGVMVPFHVLTIKGATYSTGDTENAIVRLNFNFGPSWEPGARHPGAIMLKELSYRCSDTRHAAKARLLAPDRSLNRVWALGAGRAPPGAPSSAKSYPPLPQHAPCCQGALPGQGLSRVWAGSRARAMRAPLCPGRCPSTAPSCDLPPSHAP